MFIEGGDSIKYHIMGLVFAYHRLMLAIAALTVVSRKVAHPMLLETNIRLGSPPKANSSRIGNFVVTISSPASFPDHFSGSGHSTSLPILFAIWHNTERFQPPVCQKTNAKPLPLPPPQTMLVFSQFPTLFWEGVEVDFHACVSRHSSLLEEKTSTGTFFHIRTDGMQNFCRFWHTSK